MPKKIWQQVQKEILPCTVHSAHCPKNNVNLCIKPEPVTFGADATVCLYIHMYGTSIYSILYCCFRSSSVRLGCHAEIQIIFGTVQQLHADANGSLYVSMCNIVLQSWARHNSFATTSFRRKNC